MLYVCVQRFEMTDTVVKFLKVNSLTKNMYNGHLNHRSPLLSGADPVAEAEGEHRNRRRSFGHL